MTNHIFSLICGRYICEKYGHGHERKSTQTETNEKERGK
jgi:hypothetical protein